jgi:hypothetical protein
VAKIVAASSETASALPRRSRIAPRMPGTVTVATCWERASALSSPPRTACSQAARNMTRRKASVKAAKRSPTRFSISLIEPPCPRDI